MRGAADYEARPGREKQASVATKEDIVYGKADSRSFQADAGVCHQHAAHRGAAGAARGRSGTGYQHAAHRNAAVDGGGRRDRADPRRHARSIRRTDGVLGHAAPGGDAERQRRNRRRHHATRRAGGPYGDVRACRRNACDRQFHGGGRQARHLDSGAAQRRSRPRLLSAVFIGAGTAAVSAGRPHQRHGAYLLQLCGRRGVLL